MSLQFRHELPIFCFVNQIEVAAQHPWSGMRRLDGTELQEEDRLLLITSRVVYDRDPPRQSDDSMLHFQ
jgi:hypothetical protein